MSLSPIGPIPPQTRPQPPPGTRNLRKVIRDVLFPVALIGTILGSWATPASADNCSALTDCFTTPSALLIALGVLLVALAVVLVVATAPVSVPALAGGGVLFGGAAALTTSQVAALGADAVGGTLIGTQLPELIDDLNDLQVGTQTVATDGRAVGGAWEDGPKPPPPLAAELDDIIEQAWEKHVTGGKEFPEIQTPEELKELLEEVIEHATEWGYRDDGSVYWYDEVTDTVVVKNPPGVKGSTWRPGEEGLNDG